MLLYGLNPLVLIEFLSNVHNDIYLVLFILVAMYFLLRKKNLYFTMIFLALSVCIKYSTVLLIPFILIYCFRNNTIPKRILFCLISGISIIILVVIFYLPYYRDMSIFTNMLVQGSKYSQSIMLYMMENINADIFMVINKLTIPIFLFIYITLLITVLFKKKIYISNILRKYNVIMLIFIFIVLTNLQRWYILWLLPTIIFQRKYMREFILCLTITSLIPSMPYFMVGGDFYMLGVSYSIKILIISITAIIISWLINNFLNLNRRKKENEKNISSSTLL